jgi:hypothetical protein
VKSSASRSGLDSMIVEIELTLVSIIQGVAFTFLIENARHVLSLKDAIFWPYVLIGLLVILIFWSRSVLHILTLIRWPLEYGHNFLYIACALTEALLFTRLSDPIAWFVLGAVYSAIGWALFVYDLRLLRARERDSVGSASSRLYALVTLDQWRNIRFLVPAVLFLNIICALCLHAWPEFFIVRSGHVWLAAGQLVAFAVYLFYVVRLFAKLAPLIVEARQEWHDTDARLSGP